MYLPCVTTSPGPGAVSGGHVHVRQGAAVSEQARDRQGHRMSGSCCSSLPPIFLSNVYFLYMMSFDYIIF